MYSLSKIIQSTTIRGAIHQAKFISTSSPLQEIFKIQSQQEFDEKVKASSKPVIVDFFATWCNPCKMLTPRIESIIGENSGKIKLAKVIKIQIA